MIINKQNTRLLFEFFNKYKTVEDFELEYHDSNMGEGLIESIEMTDFGLILYRCDDVPGLYYGYDKELEE